MIGPKILGQRHRHHLRGVHRQAASRRDQPRAGRGRGAGGGQRDGRRHDRGPARRARPRHRLRRARARAARSCSALYVGASVFAWLQGYLLNGVVQRTVCKLRREVEAKLNRLPLAYFDGSSAARCSAGSPTTSTTSPSALQQTLSQMLTSLLTVVGVLRDDVRDLAAARADRAGHGAAVAVLITAAIAKRAQKQLRRAVAAHRRAQRPDRGGVHRPRAGQGVRPARARSRTRFDAKNEELFQASFGAQFVSGHHHAGDRCSSGTSTTSRSRSSAACGSRRARCSSATCRRSSSTRGSSPSR